MATEQLTNHTCGDSRLACVDCAAQVCPSCFVPCPVGNRCRACSGSSKITSNAKSAPSATKKAVICLLFGALCGWMVGYITFGFISFCFAIAFWAAGRETGSQLRRGSKELAFSCMLPFLAGLSLGTVALYFYSGAVESFLALGMNIGAMAIGYFMGKCGFG